MQLFKGYVETKDKKCIEKIKGRTDFKTFEQIKLLPEYAGILGDETILIDIDEFEPSEILFKIVKDLKLQCRVYKTTRGATSCLKTKEFQQINPLFPFNLPKVRHKTDVKIHIQY